MQGDLAKESEGPCLVATFAAMASEHHGTAGTGAGILDLVREQVRLAELHDDRPRRPSAGGAENGSGWEDWHGS
jgi:hypothetical protein